MSPTTSHPLATQRIPVVGIVGGVGSGKSSVAKKLAEFVPIAIIDADKLGHEALALPDVKTKLRSRFGASIFDAGGHVIRGEVAKLVFGDDPRAKTARADLEAITHPVIDRLARDQIEQHRQAGKVRWIILDAALLLEAGWRKFCDVVAFVDVSDEQRLAYVTTQRGWSEAEWRRREASQWPVASKRAAAQIVVSNDGTLDETAKALKTELESRFGG